MNQHEQLNILFDTQINQAYREEGENIDNIFSSHYNRNVGETNQECVYYIPNNAFGCASCLG